jgi:hypothetical protein
MIATLIGSPIVVESESAILDVGGARRPVEVTPRGSSKMEVIHLLFPRDWRRWNLEVRCLLPLLADACFPRAVKSFFVDSRLLRCPAQMSRLL